MGTKRTSLGPKNARRRFAAAASNPPTDAEGSPTSPAEKDPILDDDNPNKPLDPSDSRVPFVPKTKGGVSDAPEFPTGRGTESQQGKDDIFRKLGNAGGNGSSSGFGGVDASGKGFFAGRSAAEKDFGEKGENLKQKQVEGDYAGFDKERITMAMYRDRIASMASMLQGPGQRVAAPVPLRMRRPEEVETSCDLESRIIVLGLMSARSCPWVNKIKIARNKTTPIPKPRASA